MGVRIIYSRGGKCPPLPLPLSADAHRCIKNARTSITAAYSIPLFQGEGEQILESMIALRYNFFGVMVRIMVQ